MVKGKQADEKRRFNQPANGRPLPANNVGVNLLKRVEAIRIIGQLLQLFISKQALQLPFLYPPYPNKLG